MQIEIHGITIDLLVDTVRYHATYLPGVAHERGWDHVETIYSLMRKAGFRGALSTTLLDDIKVTRYRSSKEHLSYQDYVACTSKMVSNNRGN